MRGWLAGGVIAASGLRANQFARLPWRCKMQGEPATRS
jgi:hypothetical protein